MPASVHFGAKAFAFNTAALSSKKKEAFTQDASMVLQATESDWLTAEVLSRKAKSNLANDALVLYAENDTAAEDCQFALTRKYPQVESTELSDVQDIHVVALILEALQGEAGPLSDFRKFMAQSEAKFKSGPAAEPDETLEEFSQRLAQWPDTIKNWQSVAKQLFTFIN